MVKTVVLTMSDDRYRSIADVTLRSMERWSGYAGASFCPHYYPLLSEWIKLDLAWAALRSGDRVVWLDCDILIRDY